MTIRKINPADNVAVAMEPIEAGQRLEIGAMNVAALSSVALGHKLALVDIPAGGEVVKYGYPIGFAAMNIRAGEHVHIHNLKTGLDEQQAYRYTPKRMAGAQRTPGEFWGFKRPGGRIGIRNEIWIIPTVG